MLIIFAAVYAVGYLIELRLFRWLEHEEDSRRAAPVEWDFDFEKWPLWITCLAWPVHLAFAMLVVAALLYMALDRALSRKGI